jgi:predicted DNA-binding transcriptional regulator AlpA
MPRAKAAPDDLIPTGEVAELLHRSKNAVYVMRHRLGEDGPPAYRVGGRLLFSRSEVLAWIATHAEPTKPLAG